jgi:hypothetical protein
VSGRPRSPHTLPVNRPGTHTHSAAAVPRDPVVLNTMSALLCSQWGAQLLALSGHTWQGTNLRDARDELLHRLVAQKVVRQLHQRPLQACHLLPPDALPKLHPRDPESAHPTRRVTRAKLWGQFGIRGVGKGFTFFPRTKLSSPDPVSVRTTRPSSDTRRMVGTSPQFQ